jgi:hypothetical protein
MFHQLCIKEQFHTAGTVLNLWSIIQFPNNLSAVSHTIRFSEGHFLLWELTTWFTSGTCLLSFYNLAINILQVQRWIVEAWNERTPWPESASELRRLSAKLVPTFADRGYHVVSVTDPYGSILAFLHRSRHLFSQVAPQLYRVRQK